MKFAELTVGEAATALQGTGNAGPWPPDVETIARRLGVEVVSAKLAATSGGQDALLVPRANGGFRIVVDPAVDRETCTEAHHWRDPGDLKRAVWRWRLGHELAHTLFYRPGRPPRRRRPWSSAEEDFCDAVADELLVPQVAMAARSGQDTVALAMEHLAPVAAVRRSILAGANRLRVGSESLPA